MDKTIEALKKVTLEKISYLKELVECHQNDILNPVDMYCVEGKKILITAEKSVMYSRELVVEHRERITELEIALKFLSELEADEACAI